MRRDVVLVALDERLALLRIPSLLHSVGCRVTVLGNPAAPVCRSRFVSRVIPCARDAQSIVISVKRVLQSAGGIKPWVLLTDEVALEAVGLHRGENWLDDVFPVEHRGEQPDVILRKTSFMKAAESSRIPIPMMRVCETHAEAVAAGKALGFPLFLKKDVGCAGTGVIKVLGPAEMEGAYSNLGRFGPVLGQQMVHGRVGTCNVLCNRGKATCWVHAYKSRTWPGPFGPSCVREYFCDPRLDEIVNQVAGLVRFHGFFGIDWVRDERSGEIRVIEFNGRIASDTRGELVGVDFGRGVADLLAGNDRVQRPSLNGSKAKMLHMFPQDMRRCFSEKEFRGLAMWITGLLPNDLPWHDAGLIGYFLLDFARLGWMRAARLFAKRGEGGGLPPDNDCSM